MESRKNRFTQEQYEKALKVNLLEYAKEHFEIKKKGNEYCLKDHDSLVINPRKNTFYWHSQSTGGSTIQFKMIMEGKNYVDSILELSGDESFFIPKNYESYVEPKKNFVLPEKNNTYKHIYAYLEQTRKIDRTVIQKLVDEKKLYEDVNKNAVFVAYDMNNNPKYAFKRSTNTNVNFKGDVPGSDKSFGIEVKGNDNRLYVFESPIDMMSYISITKMGNINFTSNCIALGGVSTKALDYYLENNENISDIIVCTDNDVAGNEAFETIKNKYSNKIDKISRHLPECKDFNEYLVKNYEKFKVFESQNEVKEEAISEEKEEDEEFEP